MRKTMLVAFALSIAATAGEKVPLPELALKAKTVALINGAGGETGVLDGIYSNLKKWGRWKIVEPSENPDLLLVFSASDKALGDMTTASVNASGDYASGTATHVPLMSMKRYLLLVDPATKKQIFLVECERRMSAGYTGGVLVNDLKSRIPKGQ
jgi:hypothetical protein